MRSVVARLWVVLALLSAVGPGWAETYPSRPVRVVVPYPPGSGLDAVARLVAERLQTRLGQPFTVENRAGASGNIGSELVFRSPPDGYNLLVAPPTPLVINKALLPPMRFDPDQLTPVSMLASLPNVLLFNAGLPADTLAQFIALAKQKPGQLNYASQGNGGTPHLAMELLKAAAGIDVAHIPYRGVAPALTALLAGDVQVMFADLATALPQIQAGKVKAAAVTSEARHPLLPQVPAVAETLPGFVVTVWYGMVAPPATPDAVVGPLAAVIADELGKPEVVARLSGLSMTPIAKGSAAMGVFLTQERERWARVIRDGNIKPD
ncbi:MAG: tripartite tricarboxylate transporter substrate binding protein [Hyphomicrobiales bacterium]|nr:tripartite tricarboxylate transporter substrate binding protein [Hyphomicrobiales bacterium]